MRVERLSIIKTMRRFEINDQGIFKYWERICFEEGPEDLAVECREHKRTSGPAKLSEAVEEDIIAKNQRLRAEIDYLKN